MAVCGRLIGNLLAGILIPEYIEYACIASDTGAPNLPVPQGWKETVLSYLQLYEREYEMLESLRWVLDVSPFS